MGGFDPLFPALADKARGTLELARELGIKHPSFSRDEPRCLSTDLLIQNSGGSYVAVHVKYSAELSRATGRSQELRGLEQAYWSDRGVRFVIADERPFGTAIAELLMWCLDGMHWHDDGAASALLDCLQNTNPSDSILARLKQCAADLGWRHEEAVRAFKHQILVGAWRPARIPARPDLSEPWAGRRTSQTKGLIGAW